MGKRHAVNKDRSHFERRTQRIAKLKVSRRVKKFAAYTAEVAAYWRGEREAPPAKPEIAA